MAQKPFGASGAHDVTDESRDFCPGLELGRNCEVARLVGMGDQPEPRTPIKDKNHTNWPSFVAWPFAFLVLYFLSSGPLLILMEKQHIARGQLFKAFMAPLNWAYNETPLRKPIGMYLNFWIEAYDKNGEIMIAP